MQFLLHCWFVCQFLVYHRKKKDRKKWESVRQYKNNVLFFGFSFPREPEKLWEENEKRRSDRVSFVAFLIGSLVPKWSMTEKINVKSVCLIVYDTKHECNFLWKWKVWHKMYEKKPLLPHWRPQWRSCWRAGNFQSFNGGFKSVLLFSEVHAICLNCVW